MKLWKIFEEEYNSYKIDEFSDRFLPFEKLKSFLDSRQFSRTLLGRSFLGNEIYSIKIGTGSQNILIWSQMHGNETSGTRAMFDVLEFLHSEKEEVKILLEKITLHFIPMLNPDGANTYSRRNGYGIDLNRDFLQESSPEIKILKKHVEFLQPSFLFNLHDQRSIFNVGKTPKSSCLSFLSPSADENRSLTPHRIKAMGIIDEIFSELSALIPGHISRFSDEFYPKSTGDNFMKLGFPCILMEAGHFPNDYSRNSVRKFNGLAILIALEKCAESDELTEGSYFEIPENNTLFLDVILRNVRVESAHCEVFADLGIYFVETLNTENQTIEFISRIEQIGDLSSNFGHVDYDMKGELYRGNSSPFPILAEIADFSVGSVHFEKGKFKG